LSRWVTLPSKHGSPPQTSIIEIRMLPPEKTWQYLSAAQGEQKAVALLKQLRKCVACGELDVHHMICSQCRNVRYCEAACQLRHWQFPADQHKLHCCPRR